jgi:hypothetical protein
MIIPIIPGKHTIDGVRFVISNDQTVKWRSDCSGCADHGSVSFGPPHTASSACESGKRDHCSCDRCW